MDHASGLGRRDLWRGTALYRRHGPLGQGGNGNVVPFVLWFNFAMGAAYLGAAALIFLRHPAALPTAVAIGISTGLVFVALVIVAFSGTPFEMRTHGAMILRTGFWLGAGWALRRA